MDAELPIITFGKYKHKSVLDLFNDPKYVEWLLQQAWFKDKYSNIYNIVIHRSDPANESQPTPEHNLLQNIFLDQDVCSKFCKSLGFTRDFSETNKLLRDCGLSSEIIFKDTENVFDFLGKFKVEFEAEYNWDVKIEIINSYFSRECSKNIPPEHIHLFEKVNSFFHNTNGINYFGDGKFEQCMSFSKDIYIELKPIVGDDYPCVLRKMKKQISLMTAPRYRQIGKDYRDNITIPHGIYVLLIETFNSKTTSREQLKEIFLQGNILVVFREEFD